MKTKKTVITILILALTAFTAHTDEKSDALIDAAVYMEFVHCNDRFGIQQ